MSDIPDSVWREALIRGSIWAVVGLLYGVLFVAMLTFFGRWETGAARILFAASLSGAVGALFYGSLRLALMATISSLVAAFGYLTLYSGQAINPLSMFGVSGLAGVIVGGHYGYLMTRSRVHEASARALAGLFAGFVAALPLTLMAAVFGEIRVELASATLCPLTGVIYVVTVPRFVDTLRGRLSPILSGALVGGGVAGLMGIAAWAFAGTLSSTITGAAAPTVRTAVEVLPAAAFGGMLGGFFAGAALAAAGMKRMRG